MIHDSIQQHFKNVIFNNVLRSRSILLLVLLFLLLLLIVWIVTCITSRSGIVTNIARVGINALCDLLSQ